MLRVEILDFGVDGCLLQEFSIRVAWVAMDQVAKVGFTETTLEGSEGSAIVRF